MSGRHQPSPGLIRTSGPSGAGSASRGGTSAGASTRRRSSNNSITEGRIRTMIVKMPRTVPNGVHRHSTAETTRQ